MIRKILLLNAVVGCLCLFWGRTHAQTVTINKLVTASTDDVEEYITNVSASQPTGYMYTNSSDLEMVVDGTTNQHIGVRFTGINIPAGATISHAYIQFATKGDKAPVAGAITIKAINQDNTATFGTTLFDLSSRPVTADSVIWAGSTSATWGTTGGGTQGPDQKTPDLQVLVQDILNRGGWASGNAIAFRFTGSGVRNSYSFDGSATLAPKLIIEYIPYQNQAITFNGSNSVIKKAGFGNPAGDFSIEAWAKINAGGNNTRDIISTHENGSARAGYFIEYGYGTNNTLTAGIAGSNNSWVTAQYATANWVVGQWHHVVMTYNATARNIKLYVDGEQKASTTFASGVNPVFSSRPFAIGGSDNYGNYFVGAIDEVYVWNREMSATEVDSTIHIARPVNATGLKAYYKMDSVGTLVTDYSGNGYSGTPTGLTSASVITSGAAMTFSPLTSVARYRANWSAKNTASNGGLEIASPYTAEGVFMLDGRTADSGITATGVPALVARRLQRQWMLSKTGTPNAIDTFRFSLLNNGISVVNTGKMYLLTSTDGSSFTTLSTDTGVLNNGIVTFLVPDTLNKYVTLGFSQIPGSETPLVAAGSSWKYLDNGTNQDTAWRNNNFNDASWAAGNAELGYGDGDETTVVSYGPSSSAKYTTTYFRRHFTVSSLTGYNSLRLRLKRDDGAVIYINGEEVYRDNMPTGTITSSTWASSAIDGAAESTFYETLLPTSYVDTGDNVIAVEIHQANATSSDISFDLELLKDQTVIPAASLIRGPYLNAGTPTSVVIRWRTDNAASSRVHYGTSASNLNMVAQNNTQVTEHQIKLTGLTPYTKYYYSIGSYEDTLQGDANNYFRTLINPYTDTALIRIGVIGDCGNASTNQINVRNQLASYLGTNYMDAWILLGDNAYSYGYDAEYQSEFFNIYKDGFLKQNLLFPAPGNHDYGNSTGSPSVTNHSLAPYYQNFTMPTAGEAGGVPSNNQAFYSYNVGNIHFLSLDSYGQEADASHLYDTTGAQVQWIKADLAANTNKWVVCYWHHPPYTMGSHNSDTESDLVAVRQKFIRILERMKVDLILCGHSHDYERSKLMAGHYGLESTFDPATHNLSQSSGAYDGTANSCPYVKDSASTYSGTVYVVSGSAGQLGGSQAGYPHNALAAYSDATHGGSMILEVKGNRLDAKFICADGVIRDKFTIMKDANVSKVYTINQGSNVTLTAAYEGTYSWSGNANTTKSVTVSPTDTTIYVVTDGVSCVADTFKVNVIPAFPLSVTWSYFKGWAKDNSNELEWQTLQEVNAGNYVIERSTDGKNYIVIATVKARGVPQIYNYEDAQLIAGMPVYYYRLKQVDVDGGFRYSSVVTIRHNNSLSFDVQVAPNPAAYNKMQISTATGMADAHIVVTDASGRIVVEKDMVLKNTPQSFLPDLKAGLYILSVHTENGTVNRKLIIE